MTERYALVLNGTAIEELQEGDSLYGVSSSTVGLGSADNTADADKPVSTAQQTALNLKANLISPTLVTPALGKPASGNLVNCAGIPNSDFKNLIINGGFTINQRGYVSAATLAAGAYGHDRWKAGSGGGNYSFTQLASNTTITIAADKTLIQVVEDKNVFGTTYTLAWTGTAQARYAINSATPAGAYAASPIVITGQTVGTTLSVEFNTGTLGNVQLEMGSIATPFGYRDINKEILMCLRYYECTTLNYAGCTVHSAYTTAYVQGRRFIGKKRAAPTVALYSRNGTASKLSKVTDGADIGGTVSAAGVTDSGFAGCYDVTAPFTLAAFYEVAFTASAEL